MYMLVGVLVEVVQADGGDSGDSGALRLLDVGWTSTAKWCASEP